MQLEVVMSGCSCCGSPECSCRIEDEELVQQQRRQRDSGNVVGGGKDNDER